MENGEKAPRVSVIMGVYNGERFLRESVDSVLNQNYKDFEFIICNDCSTDASEVLLRQYAAQDERIVLLKNEKNMGLGATLNHCMTVARGELIARMDCDDRALPHRFAYQVQWMEQHPEVDVLGTNVEYIDDNGDVFGHSHCEEDKVFSISDAVRASCVTHPTVMMRAETLRSVGGYTVNEWTTRAEDYDLWCKICASGGKIANAAEITFQYREDQSNISRRKYRYRMQEARLKFHWMRKTGQWKSWPYAMKPLLVGLIPLALYKKLHRKRICA